MGETIYQGDYPAATQDPDTQSMNVNQPPVWTKANTELLLQFFESGTGELFLAQISHARPGLLSNSSDPNAVALKAQLVAGYESCLSTILSLAVLPAVAGSEKTDWPDLDAPPRPEEKQ